MALFLGGGGLRGSTGGNLVDGSDQIIATSHEFLPQMVV